MHDLRCGIIEGVTEWKLLMSKGKTLVLLLILAVILLGYLSSLPALESSVGGGIGVTEPITLLINDEYFWYGSKFCIYVLFVVILSDIPSFTHGFRYRMCRMNKRSWWIGQLTLIVLFTLFYIAYVFLLSVLPMIGRVGALGKWSPSALAMAGMDGFEVPDGIELSVYFTKRFLNRYSHPLNAFGLTLWYFTAYLLATALFISMSHAAAPRLRPMGAGIMMVGYMYEFIVYNNLPYIAYYFSPSALGRLSALNFDYNEGSGGLMQAVYAPSLEYAAWVWIMVLCVLIIGLFIAAKRLRLDGYLNREE